MTITVQMLIDSLRSRTCPACGVRKASRQTVCRGCWRRLPGHIAKTLYAPLGQGYEQAVHTAITWLGATEFRMEEPEPLEVSDLQARAMVLAAIPAGPRVSIAKLFELRLPKTQLLQILHQLADSQEIVSDPESDGACTIPAFRRSDAWEEVV